MSVPAITIPQSKLDKLAADLAALEIQATIKVASGAASVPAFQRQGYMEKLGHSRQKWFKRFFVLRDSFLLSYNLQKSDFTVEPRAAIHLGSSSIQLLSHGNKEFCFLVTTTQRDRFLFACETEEERMNWVSDLEEARKITHANMIRLSVENKCLADEKGAAEVTLDNSTSALALFSNDAYIQSVPITGGAEGWLRTLGFNPDENTKKSKKLEKCYFILRDSHLMMFHGGDILTKPRGVMYLLGTKVVVEEDENTPDNEFHFKVRSDECGDEIALVATSYKVQQRWIQALKIGARVSYPDYCALLREHELLASVTMTPRAAPPSAPNQPANQLSVPPPPLFSEDVDLQGEQLDPGAKQAYDANGMPLLRNPEGKLVNSETGEIVAATEARFGAGGQQLDPFNRPLPPGAVPMFTADQRPIGVGPDGHHYLPDGTEVAMDEPHFDADGNELPGDVVAAAGAVSTDVSIALKVRAKMKGEGNKEEAIDMLGRTFRDSKDVKSDSGMLMNADGDMVPLASARKVESGTGNVVDYHAQEDSQEAIGELSIKVDNEGDEVEVGIVEVNRSMTLSDVRATITNDIETDFDDFVFLFNQTALLKYEERDRLAWSCLPEIVIRGKELKKVEVKSTFNKRIAEYAQQQEDQDRQQNEFMDIMNRVRQGKFLRSTKDQI